ncbi:hypothetical protein BG74_04505 [Sodalis-like endosymbiont of Proechinophthirus fluctus]|uniref:hypothetical protein n=1 Tax=Sodalis-like endosymbiont of Proechinophthirus fluctus TaxID=1462730 RepID=UPI0007A80618|nr:hypothetical protein [Sodalis-like endosymbiont of Proechinophthirus fluctus]KYP97233.1 hypothetical protein BG74_04505 [Sodalis-like endosymbiont of Proechinophthirus fluctus]
MRWIRCVRARAAVGYIAADAPAHNIMSLTRISFANHETRYNIAAEVNNLIISLAGWVEKLR